MKFYFYFKIFLCSIMKIYSFYNKKRALFNSATKGKDYCGQSMTVHWLILKYKERDEEEQGMETIKTEWTKGDDVHQRREH